MASIPVKQKESAQPTETVEDRFRRLATCWLKAIAHHSSTTVRNNHPAYREIICLESSIVIYARLARKFCSSGNMAEAVVVQREDGA